MFTHVATAKYIDNYRIWIAFNDGKQGEIDLKEKIKQKMEFLKP